MKMADEFAVCDVPLFRSPCRKAIPEIPFFYLPHVTVSHTRALLTARLARALANLCGDDDPAESHVRRSVSLKLSAQLSKRPNIFPGEVVDALDGFCRWICAYRDSTGHISASARRRLLRGQGPAAPERNCALPKNTKWCSSRASCIFRRVSSAFSLSIICLSLRDSSNSRTRLFKVFRKALRSAPYTILVAMWCKACWWARKRLKRQRCRKLLKSSSTSAGRLANSVSAYARQLPCRFSVWGESAVIAAPYRDCSLRSIKNSLNWVQIVTRLLLKTTSVQGRALNFALWI